MSASAPEVPAGIPLLGRLAPLISVALLSLGAVLVLSHASSRHAEAQQATPTPTPSSVVRFDPPTQTVSAGTEAVVDVLIDNVSDLAAYDVEVTFEPSVISFVSFTNGPFLGSTGRSVTCLPPLLDVGSVRVGCVTTGGQVGVSGSGLLFTLRFGTSCSGTSPLDMPNIVLTDTLGNSFSTRTESGSVSVTGGSACPTPTPTSTPGAPTATPTVTPTASQTPTATATPAPELCEVAGGTALCVLPPSQPVFSGELFAVQVAVDNVTNLGGFQLDLVFNSAVLEPVDISVGGFLGSTGRTVFCVPSIAEDRVELACSTLGSTPAGPDGSGVLADVVLQARENVQGISALQLEDVILADIRGARIPVAELQDGSVTVLAAPTATPTSTPTSTPTKTVTPTVTGTIPATSMFLDPTSQQVTEGSDIVVDVAVEGVVDLGAYEFVAAYDPTLLTFVSVTEGPFLSSNGGTSTCAGPQVDAVAGTVRFGCVMSGAAGPSGDGVLTTLQFSTACGGEGLLELAETNLQDTQGASIVHLKADATVAVIGDTTCPTAVPTSTPSLTFTPTDTVTPGPTPATTVFIDPSALGVTEGDDALVDVAIDNVTDLGAYLFDLTYDPTVLSVVEVTNGTFLGSAGGTVTCLNPQVDAVAGTVRFGCVVIDGAAPSGSGVLASVRFATSCAESSSIGLPNVELADSDTTPIPRRIVEGEVTVLGSSSCPTPVPTATSTLTRTPTRTPTPGPTPATLVSVDPSHVGITAGDETVVDIAIAQVADLAAYNFELTFDTRLLDVLEVSNGPFLSEAGGSVACVGPTIDEAGGLVSLGCVTTGVSGVTGGGVLATIRLRAVCAGETDLRLVNMELADSQGASIARRLQHGTVTVLGDAACPTPTRTPTRTPTATSTPQPGLCGPATEFVVCFLPEEATISRGDETTMDVAVDAVPELGSFQFTINFDPALVTIPDIDAGAFLGSTGRTVTCFETSPAPGSAQIVCNTLGSSPPGPTGSGVLAVARVSGVALGTSPLTLSNVILTDLRGLAYPPPALRGASVTVVEPTPTHTPTVTLTPTVTPSPTPCPPEGCPTPTTTPSPTVTPTLTNTLTPSLTPTTTPTLGPLTVRISPPSQTVAEADIVQSDVVVDGARNLGTFQFTLTFDPSHIGFQTIVDGPFLGSTGRSVTCLPPIVESGEVTFTCHTVGSTPEGPTGSGVLATVTFLAILEGTSPLELSGVSLADIRGTRLEPVILEDGGITVIVGEQDTGSEGDGTPTATLTPTATPTLSPTALATATPTASPTLTPTALPTATPTALPTATPTALPTATPTPLPTATPTVPPTATVHVASCFDLDGDGRVLISDVLFAVRQYGSDDVNADVNGDGIVRIGDILLVVDQYGLDC